MDSTIMDFPLTMQCIAWRSQNLFHDKRMVSRSFDGITTTCTYREFFVRVRKLASALSGMGLRKGDVVGSIAWNHRAHLELYLAATLMGFTLHTINVRFYPNEMKHTIDGAGDRLLFIDEDVRQTISGIDSLKGVDKVLTFQSEEYRSLVEDSREVSEFPKIGELEAAIICYTSGTTGHSKGVSYSHRSVFLHSLALLASDALGISGTDNVMPVVPMYHISAWDIPFASLMTGANLILPGPRPRPRDLVSLIEKERVSLAAGAPTIWIEFLQFLEHNRADISSLKTIVTGGSEPPLSMIKRLQGERGIRVVHAWGMTETEAASSVNRSPLPEPLSRQGVPIPGVEIKVADGDGNELPWDGRSAGMLLVRGAWVTRKYLHGEASDKFLSSGDEVWLRTGDVVTVDESGCIKIVDREKDLIRSGAEWISSIDLENSIMSHPAVVEAAVVARPDERWGERPLALVVLRERLEKKITAEDIREYIDSLHRYPKWWLPDDVFFVDSIPKTSTGKIDKKSIRMMLSKIRKEKGSEPKRHRGMKR